MLSNKAKSRLLETAATLCDVPDSKFDFNVFGRSRNDQDKIAIEEGYCNTVGCAIGWECSTQRAKDRGFSLKREQNNYETYYVPRLRPLNSSNPDEELDHWEAVSEYYDMTKDQAMFCFYIRGGAFMGFPYATTVKPAHVIEVILKFIKNDGDISHPLIFK